MKIKQVQMMKALLSLLSWLFQMQDSRNVVYSRPSLLFIYACRGPQLPGTHNEI